MIYLAPLPRFVTGTSGQRYYSKPNMILVDVKAEDAGSWIAAKQARKPTANDLTTLNGYLARQ